MTRLACFLAQSVLIFGVIVLGSVEAHAAKKPAPKKVTIRFLSYAGTIEVATVYNDESGPNSCDKHHEEHNNKLSKIKVSSNFDNIPLAPGTFFAKKQSISGRTSAEGTNVVDLQSCSGDNDGVKFVADGNCQVPNLCTTPVDCDGSLIAYPGAKNTMTVTGTSKAYTVTITGTTGAYSNCAGETLFHWWYSNPKPVPNPLVIKLKLTPISKSKFEFIAVDRSGKVNCATPTVKAIAGGKSYQCNLFYNIDAGVSIDGPYKATLLKVAPWDK